MLVVKKRKCLVLRARDAARITAVIPTAKPFMYKGTELVAVPHRLAEVKVLRNLGIRAPSPIRYHYKWSGRFTPFKAQVATAEFLTLNSRAFVLNDLGSGKTQATLWAFDYLRALGLVKRMLVIAPLSTLERTWGDTIWEHFPHLTYTTLHGTKDKRKKLLEQEHDIYVINHDGVQVLLDDLNERPDIDVVVVDEIAQAARNANTDRWEAINSVVNRKDYIRTCWGLTGTPTPNAPTDAWAQCKLVSPSSAPPYFRRFRDAVMRQVGPYRWEPRENATETVKEMMQPAIRFSRADCVDLPPTTMITREVPLTSKQERAYKTMLKDLHAELEDGSVTALNEAVKMGKLVQIACGVVYDSDGNEVTISSQPRLDAVEELVEESASKAIVFVPFVSSIEHVAGHLEKKGYMVARIHGGVPKGARDVIFRDFQKAPWPKVIVAQPAAMSHGLTLTAASTIIWYAPITSNDTYEQANARITRPGQTHNTVIANIESTPLERKMFNRLRHKQSMQNLLLEMVRNERVVA